MRKPAIRFYLAARYSRHVEMQGYRDILVERGHEVTSRWINGGHEINDQGRSLEAALAERKRLAIEDYEDLKVADAIINFTEEPRKLTGRGGRHVEFGIAYAMQKLCIVIGHRENVFHTLPGVRFHTTWSDFEKYIYWYNPQDFKN